MKLNKNDIHVIVSGKSNTAQVYDAEGKLLQEFDAFPHGVNGPAQNVTGGDTVAGTYKYGKPVWTQESESVAEVKRPYGRCFIPMLDINGVEAAVHRAGIGTHGGGRISDYWDLEQQLTYTMGCVRLHNKDVVYLGHLVDGRTSINACVYVTVSQ